MREPEANDCAGCRLWGLCHGGCPLDAWAAHGTLSGRSGRCAARRGLVEEVIEPVTGRRHEPRGVEAGA